MLSLGTASFFGYDMPMEKRLGIIAQAGFNTTFLWFDEEEEMIRDGRADEMPSLVKQYGLKLDNIHAGFRHSNFLWSESKAEQKLYKAEIEKTLRFCGKHHIPILVMHITLGFTPPPQTQEGIEIIRELVSQAKELGVIIALENLKRPDYLEPVFSQIKSGNLGFCYDCSQDFLQGQSQGGILKKWGNLLTTTHISDAKGVNDDHLQLGEGTIDWNKFVKAFPRDSYKGTLLLEIAKHDAATSPESYLKTGFTGLLKIAKMLEKRR
jgi:sugar phosphate isomerase/epimerase